MLHHPEYRERYAANLRRELPRIPFVSASSTELSSRAQANDSRANHSAESRDPLPLSTEHRPTREFSLRSSPNEVGGRGTSRGQMINPAEAGSFDSAAQVASDSDRSAQDDNAEKGGAPLQTDLDLFRAFVAAGQRLAEIHVNYEQQPEYPLTKTEKAGEKLDWRVTKMRLSKDKSSLIYNRFLTLSGIPPQTYEYRLGNRSALEWVIDQYQVSTDKRSGITNDPNRTDDPEYIVRLIGQIITVSLETVKIVAGLPKLKLEVRADQSLGVPASN